MASKERYDIHISPFMLGFNLPMTELLCYAVIYNFSKDGKTVFFGGQNYLALQVGKSRPMVNEALKNLENKGLVCKKERDDKYGYVAILDSKNQEKATCQSVDTPVGVPTPPVDRPNLDVGVPTSICQCADTKVRCADTNNIYNINNKYINKSESVTHTRTQDKPIKKLEVIDEINFVPPPTLAQVQEYVADNGLDVDPKYFWEYYEASGWCDRNGRLIEFWQQKLLRWHKEGATQYAQQGKPRSARQEAEDSAAAYRARVLRDRTVSVETSNDNN